MNKKTKEYQSISKVTLDRLSQIFSHYKDRSQLLYDAISKLSDICDKEEKDPCFDFTNAVTDLLDHLESVMGINEENILDHAKDFDELIKDDPAIAELFDNKTL